MAVGSLLASSLGIVIAGGLTGMAIAVLVFHRLFPQMYEVDRATWVRTRFWCWTIVALFVVFEFVPKV